MPARTKPRLSEQVISRGDQLVGLYTVVYSQRKPYIAGSRVAVLGRGHGLLYALGKFGRIVPHPRDEEK